MEKERKISILQDVIRIKSVNGNEEEVAKYFQDLLKEYDIESELVPWEEEGRSSLVATIKKGEGKVLGILILLIGLSRIYLGVHYPSDVIAGFSLGFMWLTLSIAFLGLRFTREEFQSKKHYSFKDFSR